MMTIAAINALAHDAFVAAFGGIAEHSPWIAEAAARVRPFPDREGMIRAFHRSLRGAPPPAILGVLRAHPDLAAKARMTEDSAREQAGAGIDSLDAGEFGSFTRLNSAYRAKFGFPFIFAVRGASKTDILSAFERRIGNDADAELSAAIEQVCRIMRLRIEDRVAP